MKYRTILLLGQPGAGKGTQGKILGTIPNFFHCACGDVFRSLSATNPLGRVFIEYSSKGQLVPDEATIELWQQFIQNCVKGGRFNPEKDTLILDGIPRNVNQAKILKDLLDVQAIFCLHCTNAEAMVQRLQQRALKENRLDDANLKVIRDRLKVYDEETKPLLDYYGKKFVHRINSTQTPSNVLHDLLKHLTKVIK